MHAVATWMVPTGMTSHVHAFDPRDDDEGGSFRISLTYEAPTGSGKTTAHTDTFHDRFMPGAARARGHFWSSPPLLRNAFLAADGFFGNHRAAA